MALGQNEYAGPVDSTSNILLMNRYVQLEATEAINDMYNFQFDRAKRQFQYLKKQYGWHPLPYFLLGLNYWWQILPNLNNKSYDETFLAYMDTSLVLSERLYDEVNEIEGAFFIAASHAFKGRLYSERGQYTKAAFAGKNTLKYMEQIRGQQDFSPELLFSDGLFNYYSEWIRENYPLLRPIMSFFPKGDKEKGIEQLKETARNAFYSRTEAQYFLMRILYAEEGDMKGAMQVAEYLYKTFPANAYFHRYYTRLLYQTGQYNKAVEESLMILERLDLAQEGYEFNSGRYAGFFLGHIHELQGELDEATQYFLIAKDFGELAEATHQGYYIYSILHLGRIAERQEKIEKATEYYTLVRKITKRKHSANKVARDRLRNLP
ncbi:MAG: tol-pal system protein YbgF [Cyclobacteriaceae bacterium]|nr:tol-pal system protein YbgF [Cyclobacteriaceae bacterium HetDA_MAG_MS6]